MVEWFMIEAIIVAVLLAIAGFILLGYFLRKREREASMELLKKELFPEMEAMTNRMLENTMKTTMDCVVKMNKEILGSLQ